MPSWFAEGLELRHMLPLERAREARSRRPHCWVCSEWAKLVVHSLREHLESCGASAALTLSCSDELLVIRCGGKLVAAIQPPSRLLPGQEEHQP